ncbi:hypothetical protein B0H63DRAFT_414524 [Podospora didyma]|uniref:Uncharacterized protein n=1 Tax=Podospora didyma TaxID=330526 RepID=A0AAE0NPS0_9PEZI|nr:hypothetical protein B0H63DRAFT_414524 [Podospora didyma]
MESPISPMRAARPIEYTLSNISTTSAIITSFIRSVRAAHSDLAAVTRELSDLRLLLELLRDEPGIPLLLQAQVLVLLESCSETLSHIDTVLALCRDASQWMEMGKGEIVRHRASLDAFRAVLALAVDAVNLTHSNEADASSIRDHIMAEVDRIRFLTAPGAQGGGGLGPVLEPFLGTLVNCLQLTRSDTPTRDGAESPTLGETGLEDDMRSLKVDQEQHEVTIAHDPAPAAKPSKGPEFGQQYETAGPWYPSDKVPLPYYSTPPPSASPTRQTGPRHVPPPFRPHVGDSPTLSPLLPYRPHMPTQPSHSFPFSQQQHPPIQQQIWQYNNSPSIRSEPFTPSSFSSFLESPAMHSDRWSDPPPNQGQGYPHSRETSITSMHMARPESPYTTPSQSRITSGISQVSGFRPGSASPVPSSGALSASSFQQTQTMSPTPSFQQLEPPKSPAQWSFNSKSSHLGGSSSGKSISRPNSYNPHNARVEITPTRYLTDKGKASEVLHIDCSQGSAYAVTKHANKILKIWSVSKGSLHGSIKITSYVQPQVRSREYFIRSHAILSENATLLGITTHLGLTLEIHNFAKAGSNNSKKLQVIDEAHRWAASPLDAYNSDYAPLVVYRPKGDRIDRFFLSRHPSAKRPFWEDTHNAIELAKSGLPFVPRFPELTYSANSSILVAAAGPRPGDPPRERATILVAWQMSPVSESKLQARSPSDTVSSLLSDDADRHTPYRYCIPVYKALQTSLPSCLVASGNIAVSIWIPAGHEDIPLPGGKFRRTPVPALERYVVVWDLPSNTTKIFAIPNVQASVSPDCKHVAYCDASNGRFVVVDVANSEEVWHYPDTAKAIGIAPIPQLDNLSKVTVFDFSPDGKMLVVGDANGGLGVFDVKDVGATFELMDTTSEVTSPLGMRGGAVNELQS